MLANNKIPALSYPDCNIGDKTGTLGGSKKGLFSALLRDNGSEAAASRMNRLARLSARYIGDHGFSIGIGDVTPDPVLQSKKEQTVRKGYTACDSHIRLFRCVYIPIGSVRTRWF